MEMEAKGQAKLMIKVRQYKSELGKLKQTVVSTTPASSPATVPPHNLAALP